VNDFFAFYGMMEMIFTYVLVFAAIGVIIRALVWWKFVNSIWKFQQFYNQQVEGELRRIAIAIQTNQWLEAQRMAQSAGEYVSTLPRHERRAYERKLSDVVKGRRRLNKESGEWESA